MREIVDVTKALSDPNRVRILLALKGRELCVCQLVVLLGLAASTVSKHMTVLRQARLVDFRKDGRWAHYRRTAREAPKAAQSALRWLDTAASDEPQVASDARRLAKILETPLEEFCRPEPRR